MKKKYGAKLRQLASMSHIVENAQQVEYKEQMRRQIRDCSEIFDMHRNASNFSLLTMGVLLRHEGFLATITPLFSEVCRRLEVTNKDLKQVRQQSRDPRQRVKPYRSTSQRGHFGSTVKPGQLDFCVSG